MKCDFSIESPAKMSTNSGKMFKTLVLLCYATTSTFETHPVDEKDPIIGHPKKIPKEDDNNGWSKYLFNRKRIQTSYRESYTIAHVVISASQSLKNVKHNKTVLETLKKDGMYIQARKCTNHNEKTGIGWLCGMNQSGDVRKGEHFKGTKGTHRIALQCGGYGNCCGINTYLANLPNKKHSGTHYCVDDLW